MEAPHAVMAERGGALASSLSSADRTVETIRILGIWLLASAPMPLLAWVLVPLWIRHSDELPGLIFWSCIILGMVWLTGVAILVLRLEGIEFTWRALKTRLWLNPPLWPIGGQPAPPAFFAIPFLFAAGWFGDYAVEAWFSSTPLGQSLLALAPAHAFIETLAIADLQGRWDVVALALVSCLFNYVLGEALLFHGVLLPRMVRAWGRWAFLGNALLFAGYHSHKFWMMPALIPSCIAYALPAQIFRSNWMSLILHGLEGVILVWVVISVVSGAA
ncbi:type II CAAX prenyl endopeptidase Rce1 family protein [Oceanicaulis sp. LC35]|uniref:CPBP family glutamic-type intramembrane protease n=1 Tax=Oceanicaulis sp. LC35 TaxID=3349635 RepID=UPI003F875E83